jgi:hypothetical protein
MSKVVMLKFYWLEFRGDLKSSSFAPLLHQSLRIQPGNVIHTRAFGDEFSIFQRRFSTVIRPTHMHVAVFNLTYT